MRLALPVLLLFALLTPGCGDPEPLPPDHWMVRLDSPDKARVDEAIEELGKWGERDPNRVVPLLERELQRRAEDSILTVRIDPEAAALANQPDAMKTLQDLALLVHQRLRLADYVVVRVVADEEGVRASVRPLPGTKDLDEGLRRLAADAAHPGAIELLAELPPPTAPSAQRPMSPWTGDAASYTTWLAAETKRFRDAEAAGKDYVPSDPAHRLARRAPPAGPAAVASPAAPGEPSDLVPLVAPGSDAARFTESDLVFEPRDDAGFPALFVSATPARASDFRAFLKAHAGRDLWLVMDGKAVLSAPLSADPGDTVAFRVRAATATEGRTLAARWVAIVHSGRYPVPISVEPVPRMPMLSVEEPLSRAVVAVGPPAEPMLERLVAKDPAWEPLVRSLRDGILRMRAQKR
jgi:hypothetical protein